MLERFISLNPLVAAEQLHLAYSSLKSTWIAPVLMFIGLFAFAPNHVARAELAAVGFMYCAIVIWNHWQVSKSLKGTISMDSTKLVYTRYFISFLCLGGLAASIPWITLTNSDLGLSASISVGVLGYSLALTFVHAAFPPAVVAYLLPLTVSFVIYWSNLEPKWLPVLVAVQVLFMVIVFRSTFVFAKLLSTSIERRHSLDELAKKAEQTSADLVTALQRLRDANIEKQRIFSAANHDLRQPLSAASALIGVLLRRIHKLKLDGQAEPILEVVEKLDNSVDVLRKTVDSLGELNRLDSGAVTTQLQLFELTKFFTELVSDFDPLIQSGGVKIGVSVPAITTITDPLHFNRIFRNLIQNALTHAPTSNIEIVYSLIDAKATISVVDHGPGVPQNRRALVFDEYVQLDNPERAITKGLGLGLSIVRRLSHLLGIELRLLETPRGGLTVELDISKIVSLEPSLPNDQGQSSVLLNAQELNPNIHRFLVLDDDLQVGESLCLLIQEMGGQAWSISDPAEMGGWFDKNKYTHALIDTWLPNASGIEVANKLRGLAPNLKIAIISGDTVGSAREEAEKNSFMFLPKPLSEADIISFVR
jgi:signal transduction histidine kinase